MEGLITEGEVTVLAFLLTFLLGMLYTVFVCKLAYLQQKKRNADILPELKLKYKHNCMHAAQAKETAGVGSKSGKCVASGYGFRFVN